MGGNHLPAFFGGVGVPLFSEPDWAVRCLRQKGIRPDVTARTIFTGEGRSTGRRCASRGKAKGRHRSVRGQRVDEEASTLERGEYNCKVGRCSTVKT